MDRFDVILLAAQRTGVLNPLAEKYGVSHKCIVPIDGVPLLERVLATLTAHPGCRTIHLLIEKDGMEAARSIVEKYERADLPIRPIAPSENIAESVLIGCRNAEAPYVITTADNVLLRPVSIDQILADIEAGGGAVIALARRNDVRAVHPEAQRHFYRFRDDSFANCNLYAIAGPKALSAAEVFREGGQFMNHPGRLISLFGLFNILLLRAGFFTLDSAFRRISKILSVEIRTAVLADGTQAIDVDNERTYNIVEGVLRGKFPAEEAIAS